MSQANMDQAIVDQAIISHGGNLVAGVLWHRAATNPGQLAIIENQRGRWIPMTVRQLADRVASLALALSARGVRAGSCVAVLVANRSDWLVVDLAVQAVGAVSAAVPPSDDDENLAGLLEQLGAGGVVVDDPIAVQRLDGLSDAGRLDRIGLVVQLGVSDDRAEGVDDLVSDGVGLLRSQPSVFAEMLAQRQADEPATLTYSSGSGGAPRAVEHNAGAVHAGARQVAGARGLVADDVTVVALDPSHPFERSLTLYPALVSGAVLAYPESASTVDRAILEVQPTFAHLPIELVRQATATIRSRLHRNRGVKRLVARWWERAANQAVRAGREPSRHAVRFVGTPALRTVGWDRLGSLVVTCVAVPVEIAGTLAALGRVVDSGYGVVETGLVGIGRGGSFTPLAGTTVSTTDGVLTVAGPALARPSDGAVLTNDLGRVENGRFVVTGPAASTLTLADGSSVVAASIEGRLRESPYVALAVVSAPDGAPHAALEIDRIAVGDWAAARNLSYTTLTTLVALPEVRTLIADEVARLATEVATHDLLQRPLQQGRDITRTRTTVHGRLHPVGAHEAPSPRAEQPSAVE